MIEGLDIPVRLSLVPDTGSYSEKGVHAVECSLLTLVPLSYKFFWLENEIKSAKRCGLYSLSKPQHHYLGD